MDEKETITLQGYSIFDKSYLGINKNLYNPFYVKSIRFNVPCEWLERKAKELGYDSIESLINGMTPELSREIFDSATDDKVRTYPFLYYMKNTSVEEIAHSNIADLASDIKRIHGLLCHKKHQFGFCETFDYDLLEKFPEETRALINLLEPLEWKLLELLREKDAINKEVEPCYMYIDFLNTHNTMNTKNVWPCMGDLSTLHRFFDNVKEPAKKTKESVMEYEHCKKVLVAVEKRVHKYLEAGARGDTMGHLIGLDNSKL